MIEVEFQTVAIRNIIVLFSQECLAIPKLSLPSTRRNWKCFSRIPKKKKTESFFDKHPGSGRLFPEIASLTWTWLLVRCITNSAFCWNSFVYLIASCDADCWSCLWFQSVSLWSLRTILGSWQSPSCSGARNLFAHSWACFFLREGDFSRLGGRGRGIRGGGVEVLETSLSPDSYI